MEITYNDKTFILIEEPHFEYHDSIGCMSAISSEEWVTAKAVDESNKSYDLWWKCRNGMDIKDINFSEPDDILDEYGKYIK